VTSKQHFTKLENHKNLHFEIGGCNGVSSVLAENTKKLANKDQVKWHTCRRQFVQVQLENLLLEKL